MADPTLGCWNIADLRDKARARLPHGVWEYMERGVEDERCMDRNRAALDALTFVPRVLRKVDAIDMSSSIFGQAVPLPLAIAPTGAAGLIWHKGDLHLARAAAKAGVPFTISSAGTMDVEDVVAGGGRQWFQLYMWRDRDLSYDVVRRAHGLGCEALFVTLDLPVMPNREYLYHNGYGMPIKPNRKNVPDMLLHPRWLAGVVGRYLLQDGGMPTQANLPPGLKHSMAKGAKPGAHFKQDDLDAAGISRLRDLWPGKLVLKGIMHPDDARQALALGADGIVVSNHGARSLDGSIAAIDALPGIVEAVGGKLTVFFDSGVRRGSDVVKARALGADVVMVGRATLYGLAAAGEAGVTRALELLQAEVSRTMAMLGARDWSEVGPEVFGLVGQRSA
ncbi:alpha-hydroxy-acid oxidizing protein [Altererythrobacter sp. KTW20L]|uniref:alpha-hydroxy acid oxidase n=1 Tax=Altererythrobacter sp. KTW20L TaxID=2942210 RepID=UPI0020BFC030|nr:alpha-hydroxy acid oxidase [Altererythrobacter sp. KTW20L]MCL6251126.1 alpha-hydroxy-acid oxidizing protein [Altererythrobacter sp. KTW20L]